MRVVISSGHGKFVRGASGYLDEVDEARHVVETVADNLTADGVECITFHDNTSTTQDQNLETIVDFHNKQQRDLDVSVHFNAYQTTSKPMGTECLYVTQNELADEVSAAIAAAAHLPDRGPKLRQDLYFLNNNDKPAILIETCFVDSSADAHNYGEFFQDICGAIADVIGGGAPPRPPRPRPPRPDPGPEPSPEPDDKISRPTIEEGDYGSLVRLVQEVLRVTPVDGDFGGATAAAVEAFQRKHGLDPVDGVVGKDTWAALDKEFNLPPYPTPFLAPLAPETVQEIEDAAASSDAADLLWVDRGQAPLGFIQGMALAYATCVRKYEAGDLNAAEMAKADTGNTATDALAYFRPEFQALGMDNSRPGRRTLRHVFVLLLGLGMRESSGQYCCGRDTSAGESSQSSDTCEAGMFQTSYNYHVCATDADELLDQYRPGLGDGPSPPQCQLRAFQREVECGATDWENIGSGRGRDFQALSKECPAFAVESAAVGVRNIRQHWGPINRKELELTQEANDLFKTIDDILSETAAVS
jgi:peptidoglycan hydrolase-like protein with peptidoglycan-binding domain